MTKSDYQREWRKKNKEHALAYHRKYRQEHKEAIQKSIKKGVEKWRQNNPELNRERNRLYRAKRRALTKNRIVLEEIHNWDSRVCGICDVLVEGEYHLDHIIPLKRGGEHIASNLQVAHPSCNRSKFTSLPGEKVMVILN